MKNNNVIAYVLIGLGALALLSRTSGDTGWFWVGLVAAAFLTAYARGKHYGLLIPGSILTGIAVGLMLEGAWGWDGAFLISLGLGFVAIDRVEPRKSRWPVLVGGILALLGLLIGLAESGALGSIWLALMMIGGGVYLMRRQQGKVATAAGKGWVKVDPGTASVQPTATPVQQPTADAEADKVTAPQAAVSAEKGTDVDVSDTLIDTVSIEEDAPEALGQEGVQKSAEALDEALYEQLNAWRSATAKLEDRAAYLILTNSSLEQIATEKPTTLQALKNIKGIGPVKLERYGEAILDLVNS